MITQAIQRFFSIMIGMLPFAICLPLIESFKNEKLEVIFFLIGIVWFLYLNAWSKRAYALYDEERTKLYEAWSKARVCLNTDIITKLAFLPVIGFVFDNWRNRNDPTHQDDREIRVNTGDDK